MSDSENDKDELNEEQNPENGQSRRQLSQRARRNNHKNRSTVERYFKKILTSLSSSSSSSNDTSGDDDGDDQLSKTSGEDSYESDEDDTDWSSATDQDEVNTVNPENCGTSSKSAGGDIKTSKDVDKIDAAIMSDSSDGSCEKCPICLLSFRDQEVGIPETCEHKFCFICIEEWAKNVSTCPIDRKEFASINVKENYEADKIMRKIKVQLNDKSQDGGGDMTSVELTFCEVCNNPDREDLMLLCDECNRGFHLFCLSPPLAEVPQGSWYCDNCFSSESNYSDNDVEELLEDVRDLGEPSTRLRTTVRRTPRITRTRQSERIRAAIIARTRYSRNPVVIDPNQPSTSSGFGSIIDAVNRRLAQQNRRIVRRAPPVPVASTRKKKKSRRTLGGRRRRVKQKIVEYGLDQDANKFPIEVIKSKRHKKYKKRCGSKKIPSNRRSVNHSRELLKSLPDERSRLLAQLPIPKLDLFGAKGQLDYFSSDEATDDENSSSISRDISGVGNSGGGTLIQTTSRNRIGSRRLLNRQKTLALNIHNPPDSTNTTGSIDLLSSILDTQERWHSTRNLSNVQIAEDGRLILENREKKTSPVPVPNPNDINEAPMYPRGGGGNSGIGGTGRYSGGYNNNNNRGGYYNNRGGGGGGAGHNSNYRSSTDGNFNGSTSYNNYSNSGGYNQSNDFSGGSSSNFRGGRGRFPTNNYTPRGGGIGGNNSGTPNNPNSNIRFKFNRRSVNLPNPSTTTNTDLPTSSLAVQNEEITEGREIVSNSSHETIDSTSTSEVISDEIPTPSNIFEPPQLQINNDEERIEPMSSSINSENIVSSSDQTDKLNNVELNDDDEDDDCPNFSVYSAVSMDIAKESENSSHELSDAPTAVKKDGSSNNGTTVTLGHQNSGNMPNTDGEEDGEKEEDLVQLDDDDIEDEGENIAEEEPKSGIKTKDDYPDDDGDDDDDDDDDGDDEDDDDKKSANKTIPLEHNKDNLNKTSNNNSNINSKKEKVLELYDDSDWEEWNIDKNDEEKVTEEAHNYIEPASDHIITDVLVPQEEKELTEEISEEDERSYTPCLDEKQQKPDTNKFNTSNESETPLDDEQAGEAEEEDDQNEIEASGGTKPSTSGIGGLDTEMISDEDEEIFNEETHQKDNHELKDVGRHIESNNKSKWIKRRGGDGHNSFKKISKNTKERNYRDKDKKRKRSRSRSNDKENKIRGMRKKDKRKDLERYNVRTIINERPRPTKDKYGRDLSARILKSPTRSKSRQRSGSPRHSRSSSRRRTPMRRSFSRRRSFSPRRRSSSRDHRSRSRQRSFGKLRGKRSHSRSRSKSRVAGGGRLNGGKPKAKRHRSRSWTSKSHSRTRSRSISKSRSFSISRSRTRTPIDRPIKQHPINRRPRKKEARRRELSIEHRSVSPRPATIATRRKKKTVVEKASRRRRQEWSASRSKTPEISWTPPYQTMAVTGNSSQNLTVTLKNKDTVRKKKDKKRKERRKEQNERRRDKKRQRADKQASPIPPSKEVFASGNNILVSVSFNKNQQQPPQQTTVVTLPASRSQIVSSAKRRDENTTRKTRREKNKEGGIGKRHKKVDMKPVAIIDLDRSPFKEMTPSPKDVIVLDDDTDEESEANKEKKTQDTQENIVTLQHEEETEPPMRVQQASQPQSPVVDDSFDLLSPGPKTPPEPPTVKFSMSVKSKNTKLRVVNPLHDAIEEEVEVLSERETENVAAQKDQNKIGPNTPPEPAPTSPDAYDPFEPTKSPSPSPSPAPPDMGDMSTNDDDVSDNLVESTQECIKEDKRPSQTQEKILNPVELVMALINNKTASIATTSSSAHADITSTSGDNFNLQTNESQIIDITSMQSASPTDKVDDPHKQITVLSNVFIQAGTNQTSQSRVTNVVGSLLLPSMSNSGRSPIKSQFNNPTSTTNKSSPIKLITLTKQTSQKIISITQLPKLTGNTNNNNNNSSGGGASGANISDLGGDDGGNDFGSPYSPGSSDYDDLFEPPMDTSSPPPILPPIRSHKTQGNKNKNTNNNNNNNPVELFDNLFGSTSPIHMRLSSNKTKSKQQATNKMHKKTPVKGKVYHKPGMGKLSDDQLQILDDLPSSAVELQVKDKFLRKLNRQERVVEEVKLVLKPHYNKKHISKEEYKNIMRRAVPKICHNRTGEINPQKIQNLIEAYVKKYRHRRKILNNNAVSSSNKCVDFLNKLN